ncbi:Hydroxymethylglutaryl-CoA synthase [Candidatus Trichorickettsia mobilis]|uniref:Hydroxymethylglutaryl-CoA synthase n=1 Tax=Candidatus Trichorickettsia mobilis TaxID=1346319 RepID=A0ABZ0UUL4_9RICK|nr:hydroxymethylglutaryl-CoA synthase [Candidatus Trichorickettsia mobilis]WPY01348.1 Hydroxymethylglutaryl-CoA synthase [Candidatus Trichorickettsia mobilis]
MLLFATESGIDQSKAAGIFVHNLLQLPSRCRVVELKQACYSATVSLQMALPMLYNNLSQSKKILLIASDIARYGLNSSGESSQGAGAVAMILSQNPRILAIEPESGFHTEDVPDFWRPNYKDEAIVDGKYSCELYLKLLQKTWKQYTALSGRTYEQHARFCYHVSVPRLVEKAQQSLLALNALPELSVSELKEQLEPSLQYGRVIGNCYTASLYLSLISLLDNTSFDLSEQRIGFYSYGSGCVAEFFSGIIQKDYQTMLYKDDHQTMLMQRKLVSTEEYENFYNFSYPLNNISITIPKYKGGRYRLAAIDEHKRIYKISI